MTWAIFAIDWMQVSLQPGNKWTGNFSRVRYRSPSTVYCNHLTHKYIHLDFPCHVYAIFDRIFRLPSHISPFPFNELVSVTKCVLPCNHLAVLRMMF